jgi:hypothetical protein
MNKIKKVGGVLQLVHHEPVAFRPVYTESFSYILSLLITQMGLLREIRKLINPAIIVNIINSQYIVVNTIKAF